MTWLEDIFKGGTEGIFNGLKGLIQTVKADPLELLKIQQAINDAELKANVALLQAQTRINEIEAGSTDKFVSRWRPAVGWICVIGLGYSTLIQPLGAWLSVNLGGIAPPVIDVNVLMGLVTSLLGLGAYRSFDKMQGATK